MACLSRSSEGARGRMLPSGYFMDYIIGHLPSFMKAVTYQLLTPALCKASRWVPWGISPPCEQLRLRYAQWASTGIWAAANQWLSFAVDRIHHDHGTFSEWSLSTCISVTETLVKGANQRGHILWLLVPWALSPSQRNKKNNSLCQVSKRALVPLTGYSVKWDGVTMYYLAPLAFNIDCTVLHSIFPGFFPFCLLSLLTIVFCGHPHILGLE